MNDDKAEKGNVKKIIIRCKNKSFWDIAEELEEKMRKNPEAMPVFKNYPSRWDRSKNLRGVMKIARELGAEIEVQGRKTSNPLEKLTRSIEEMDLGKPGEFVDLVIKIAALQPCGVLFNPQLTPPTVSVQNTPALGGYPRDGIEEILDEDDLERLNHLIDLEIVELKEAKTGDFYSLTKEGENVVEYYIETELKSNLKDIVDELADKIGLRLTWAYFHPETLGNIDNPNPVHDYITTSLRHTLPNRAMDYGLLNRDSLIGYAIKRSSSKNCKDGFEEKEWKDDDGKIIPKIRKVWDILEDLNLAINAPKVNTEIQMMPERTRAEMTSIRQVRRIRGVFEKTGDYQRCIPVALAEKLTDMISERLAKEKKVIAILMMISKYRKTPKKVSRKIKMEDNEYGLSKEDESLLEDVIHSLYNKGITGDYSQTSDAFVFRDKSAFDEFLREYLLENEDLEI